MIKNDLQHLYIDYYTSAPSADLDFLKLEEQCGKRQELLNKIEDAMSKVREQDSENPHRDISNSIKPFLNLLMESEGKAYERYSHSVLRLAYLNSQDQFINLEGHLYKIRLELFCEANKPADGYLFDLLKDFYDKVGFKIEQIVIPASHSANMVSERAQKTAASGNKAAGKESPDHR